MRTTLAMEKKSAAAARAGRRAWRSAAVLALLLGVLLCWSGLAQASQAAAAGMKKAARTTVEKEPGAGTGQTTGQTATGQTTTGQTETGQTDPAAPEKVKKPANANKWVKKNGYTYYYGDNGKKVKGLNKIGKKTYLFDSKGRQKIGWQHVDKTLDKKAGGGYYSYFQMKNGKNGYMIKGKAVNGISIAKNGKVRGGGNRLSLLIRCAQIVESHTRPTWSVGQKMSTIWHWFQNNIGYRGLTFRFYDAWDVYYGTLCFTSGWASCEGLGCAWAFLANACGASGCYSCASGGHGWAEVAGRIYDPACARYDGKRDSYYAMDPAMSGVGGRPAYTRSGARKLAV